MIDKTCLSWWFPKIRDAGLPVPKTIIIELKDKNILKDIFSVFDGEKLTHISEPFFNEIKKAADEIGYPFFLRTGQTSAKHNWSHTCFVSNAEQIQEHVIRIVEYSEMVSIMGVPWDVWAVRQFLPTLSLGTCSGFGGMPICREFRFFVDGGKVLCWHPYWPIKALVQGGAVSIKEGESLHMLYERLCVCSDESPLYDLAIKVGEAVEGEWSVDLLETERGWYVTDMAETHKSFHWEGCVQKGKA